MADVIVPTSTVEDVPVGCQNGICQNSGRQWRGSDSQFLISTDSRCCHLRRQRLPPRQEDSTPLRQRYWLTRTRADAQVLT